MTFTGLDWRKYKRQVRATVLQGDVMVQAFAPDSFDWIVSISALEHVGLGHYAGDPKHADGDVIALAKCWEWLSPGGWLYFDVPYNPARYQVVGSSHRIYDAAAIAARLHQGRAWIEGWRGAVKRGRESTLVAEPQPTHGGEDFYYIGFWWQKPATE
jgi:SAM-dependent methyltransferase